MEKLKRIIKHNIFGFILGGIIFGSISAYAATFLASSSVSYSNTTGKLSSTNVQGAIDELYDLYSNSKCNVKANDMTLNISGSSSASGGHSSYISGHGSSSTVTAQVKIENGNPQLISYSYPISANARNDEGGGRQNASGNGSFTLNKE